MRRWQWNSLIVLAASVALGNTVFAENGLFAGISEVTARASGNTQVLHFEADLPFDVQSQVLDANRIRLHLFDAQLSSNLSGPDGHLNIAGTGIQSAVRTTDGELILTGPGLGGKQLIVEGATLRANLPELRPAATPVSARPIAQQHAQTGKTKPVVTFPQNSTGTRTSAPADEAYGMLGADIPEPRIDTGNPAVSPRTGGAQRLDVRDGIRPQAQPFSRIAPSDIASGNVKGTVTTFERTPMAGFVMDPAMMNAMSTPEGAKQVMRKMGPLPAGPAMVDMSGSAAPELPPQGAQTQTSNELPVGMQEAILNPGTVLPTAEPELPPEPSYQFVQSLPKYTGGAPPIKAVTLDNQGRAISLSPKNKKSVMEVEWGEGGGLTNINPAYDIEQEGAAKVSKRMQQALAEYRARRFPQAQKLIDEALAMDSTNPALFAALGEIDVKLSRMVEAEKAYQQAALLDKKKYGKRYAELLILQDKRDEAATFLKDALQEDSKQADLAYLLGTLLEERGDHQTALMYLEQAARLHPASGDIQYNLGLAYEFSGDKEKAEAHYQKAVELDPKAADAQQALTRLKR